LLADVFETAAATVNSLREGLQEATEGAVLLSFSD
jgi:hypothetical protein